MYNRPIRNNKNFRGFLFPTMELAIAFTLSSTSNIMVKKPNTDGKHLVIQQDSSVFHFEAYEHYTNDDRMRYMLPAGIKILKGLFNILECHCGWDDCKETIYCHYYTLNPWAITLNKWCSCQGRCDIKDCSFNDVKCYYGYPHYYDIHL